MVTYEIIKHLGVVRELQDGWKREVNIVSWNEGKPKLDIRDWNGDRSKMTRGLTFPLEDTEMLCMILHNYMRARNE